MVKDKGHLLNAMGYSLDVTNQVLSILKNLVARQYVLGNYFKRAFDDKGFRISIQIDNFPGKGEKFGKKYKIKSGWTIFPNCKLKSNTLIGGLV